MQPTADKLKYVNLFTIPHQDTGETLHPLTSKAQAVECQEWDN